MSTSRSSSPLARAALRLAVNEARGSWRKLVIFAWSIALGIAAMTFARSLGSTLALGIEEQSRQLLGADIMLSAKDPFTEDLVSAVKPLSDSATNEVRFRTMVSASSGTAHLAQVRGFDGMFPFYGALETNPANAWELTLASSTPQVVIDETLAAKLSVVPGDNLSIGGVPVTLAGIATQIPGDASAMYAFAPRVFVHERHIPRETLLSTGAVADYYLYLKFKPTISEQLFKDAMSGTLAEARVDTTTVSDRKELLGRVSQNITSYFGLVGLIALFLGGLGAISTLTFYLRQKRPTVAILKCLGASRLTILSTFTLQVGGAAIVASLSGALLGTLGAYYAPLGLAPVLPFPISPYFAWHEIVVGVFTGTLCLLFALLPTLKELSKATPLEVIRPAELSAPPKSPGRHLPLVILALILGVISTDRPVFGMLASLGVGAALLMLFGTAWVLRYYARAIRPAWWPFSLRYALSNLDRPGNQTSLLIVAFGVTTMLLGLIVICYHALQSQTELARSGVRSTAFLIDVQPDQVEAVKSALQELEVPIQQEASITLMRLHRIGDRTVSELLTDSTHDIPEWTLHREFWSTSRADLRESEDIIQGEWVPHFSKSLDPLPVSIERKFMRRLGLSLGDSLEFDIGGTIVKSRITSVRDIRWERMERNSFLVFPEGSLAFAPSFNVYGVSTRGAAETAQLMSRLGQEFPNVSIFDVRSAVDTIERVLGYMLSVLYGLVLVVLGAAVVTLAGVVALGRGERTREQALLRTVGASHRFLRRTLRNEYALLGTAASLVGVVASTIVGALITHYGFKIPIVLPAPPLIAILLSAPLMVLVVVEVCGRVHRSISPAEALRAQ